VQTRYITARANWDNTNALPSNISLFIKNFLTGTHATLGVNPSAPRRIISPPPHCLACTVTTVQHYIKNVQPGINQIALQLDCPDTATTDQIVQLVTLALNRMTTKSPMSGIIFANIGTVNVISVSVD
jgi:hypothetical protein